MGWKPSRSHRALTVAIASASSEDMKMTRRPLASAGLLARAAAAKVLNAFTTRAPKTASATISLDNRPPRFVGVKAGRSTAFVASMTMRPPQSDIELTASGTAGNGTARITTSARMDSSTVAAFTFEPSLPTIYVSEPGPRLLASETSIPLLAKWPAKALPIAPEPMIALAIVARMAAGHQIFPSGFAGARARDHVIESEFAGGHGPVTILAGIAVAHQDIFARKSARLVRNAAVLEQADHGRN